VTLTIPSGAGDGSGWNESISACTLLPMGQVLETDALERVGTALADPTRRRILLALLDDPSYPADLAETFGIGRTNISNHLACLRGCGLVRVSREGHRVRYELSSDRLAHALKDLVGLELDAVASHADLDGRPS
jgi:DNA-binding transcriptional ArsR family regulator